MAKNQYQSQLQTAQQLLTEFTAQEEAIKAALGQAQQELQQATKYTRTGVLIDQDPGYLAAKERLAATQKQLDVVQKNRMQAQADVSKLDDLNKQDAENLSPAEQNAANILNQRIANNSKYGRYLSDEELRAANKQDEQQSAVIKDRQEGRQLQREGMSLQERMAEANRAKDLEIANLNASLRRGEIGLKEFEIGVNKAFNDRKVALENIQTEVAAAGQINTMGVTQRAQDVTMAGEGNRSRLGFLGFIGDMVKYLPRGAKLSEDDIFRLSQRWDAFSQGSTKEWAALLPRVEPHPTTVAAAAGEKRVGGSGEPTYTTAAEQQKNQGPAKSVDEAFDRTVKDKLDEFEAGKKAAGDTSPTSYEQFRDWMLNTGTSPENVPTQETVQKVPGFNAPAPVPTVNPPMQETQPTPPVQWQQDTPQPAAPPVAQQQTPAVIVNVAGQTQSPTGVDPTGITKNLQDQQNQQTKQQMHDQAAVAQTVQMLQESGVDPEVIQAFAQKHNYDPLYPNPFNDYLNQQLQAPAPV